MKKIAIIGGGNLGTAIAEGLLKSKFSKASDITVTRRNTSVNPLKPLGIDIISDNNAAVKRSDVVIFAVKPFQTVDLLKTIKKDLSPGKMLISVVTGVTMNEIESAIDKKISLFRAMPNTAISIQQSMTCLCHQHEDEEIKDAQAYIEQHYKDKLTVDQLAARFNMTRRTFERRFKKATRNTVAEYIQRVKIEGAKKQLEIGRKSINEIMVNVGYSDTQTFRNIFKRITGVTPVDYKSKYARKGA